MAIALVSGFSNSPIGQRAWQLAKKFAGFAFLCVAVYLALALWGFDPQDPSLNRATGQSVSNPAGPLGAILADLGMQLFGRSCWLFPAVLFAWGLRLLLGQSLRWPWLPPLVLPFALLAMASWLSSSPAGPGSAWPFPTGFGGMVGDLAYRELSVFLAPRSFTLIMGFAAVLLAIATLGPRLGESLGAASWLGSHANRAGRKLGRSAQQASMDSGRWVGERWQLRRTQAAEKKRVNPFDEPPVEAEKRPGTTMATLLERFARKQPLGTNVDDELLDDEVDGFETETADTGIVEAKPRNRRPPSKAKGQSNTATHRHSASPQRVKAIEPELPLETYLLPDLDFLTPVRHASGSSLSKGQLAQVSEQLKMVLADFGVQGEIIDAKPGPVITLYELEPAPGTRAQRVVNLADDIARSLCAMSVRVATVPGRNVIGIELPNDKRQIVFLKELLEHESFSATEARLALALGKDISGKAITVDLARMPHLLIAGTTGSGKSVAINAMILSLLYRHKPEDCRIIMIDPKVIELSVYEGIPHLLAPVVTEPHKAVVALKWVVRQMDERYRLMSHLGVRDIFAYNRRIEKAKAKGQELTRRVRTGFEPGTGEPIMEELPIDMTTLPLIVVIVDEVADLMLTAGKEIENAIQRLSQKARAAGIHLIVATQRPSVDVLTGVIKANLPSRISFRVSSKIDSRTILGEPGAEQLLGQGDMLHMMPGDRIVRVHGPLVSDQDVEKVVSHLRLMGEPEYDEAVTAESFDESSGSGDVPIADGGGGNDGLYNQAVQIVARDGKASTSYLQRKLAIGYNSAAKLIERMEAEGLISQADRVGRRQVLMGKGGIDGDQPTDHDN